MSSRVLIHVISIKLFIFRTEVLWESCSELKTLKLSHNVTVLKMNSLAIIVEGKWENLMRRILTADHIYI